MAARKYIGVFPRRLGLLTGGVSRNGDFVGGGKKKAPGGA